MQFDLDYGNSEAQPQKAVFKGGRPGRHAPSERKYQIQHLWEQHHRMLRLALLGLSYKDIARQLGVTPITVSNCINSSLGQKILSEMRGAANKDAVDTAAKLRQMNEAALKVLEEILEDEEAPRALRAKVAMDNLSRTGFAPQINVRGVMDHRHFGSEDIERIKLLALEAAKRNGCLVLEPPASEASIGNGQGCFSAALPLVDDEVVDLKVTAVPTNGGGRDGSCGD